VEAHKEMNPSDQKVIVAELSRNIISRILEATSHIPKNRA